MASLLIGENPPPLPAGRLWLLTRVSIVAFVGAVIGLLWYSHQADISERRATLINDMLWLEQNLRFVLGRNEEVLGRIGARSIPDRQTFLNATQTLLTGNSGLRQILWVSPDGKLTHAEPSASDSYMSGEEIDVVPSRQTLRLAGKVGKPIYSQPYPIIQDDWQVEVHVPVFSDSRLRGVVVGIYSLKRLVDESVPWWLAERYRISITHYDGRDLVSRSSISPVDTDSSYQLSFDPPGHGLGIRAVPYRQPPPMVGRVLSATLIFLAIGILWSMWALRKNEQRRIDAEKLLRDQYSFRKAMEDSLHTGLRARDLTGRITYVNPAFCKMVGWSQDELVGRRPPMPYWVEDEVGETRQIHDRILAGEGPDNGFELRFKRRDGEIITALIHEAPLINSQGKQTGWMGSMVDITDRKRADEQARLQQDRLQATSRLVAMGEMASSLAHELNQPLAAISSYCTASLNLIEQGKAATDIAPAIKLAVEQAQRAGKVVRKIYRGVRRSNGATETFPLRECIDVAIGLMEFEMQRNQVRLEADLSSSILVTGDRVLLEQVFFNLLKNAAEAVAGNQPPDRLISISLQSSECQVECIVSDRGPGIGPEISDRMFDPLFTTKPEGMGMGLAICRSAIEAMRGRLSWDANPLGGTRFIVRLPLAVTEVES